MKYLNIIDPRFDTRLFKDDELERLEMIIKSNNDRMQHKRSVRVPRFEPSVPRTPCSSPVSSISSSSSGSRSKSVILPKYCPPSMDKYQLLQSMSEVFLTRARIPTKPMLPVCKTNTAMNNYVHKLFVYESYLINQLNRQRSYHRKYQTSHNVSLKHKYDQQLSSQISRSLSRKSFSKTMV